MKRAAIIAACLLSGLVVLGIVESQRLNDEIGRRAMATLRELTGGRTEVKSIRFQLGDRSLDLDGFVVSSNRGRPVFSAPRIHVGLSLAALLGRTSQISAIDIESPQIRIGEDDLGQFLTLKNRSSVHIGNLRVRNGSILVNRTWAPTPDRGIPVNFEATGIQLTAWRRSTARYGIDCSAATVRIGVNHRKEVSGSLIFAGELNGSRMNISRAAFESGPSRVEVRGTVETTKAFLGNLTFHSHVQGLQTGVIESDGAILAGDGVPWEVSGSASGHDVSLRGAGYLRQRVTFRTLYTANAQGLLLRELRGGSSLGSFAGSAELKNWRELSASGSVQDIDIQKVLGHWAPSSRWTGKAAGTVQVAATLDPFALDATRAEPTVELALHISPGHGGIPIEGMVKGSYSGRTNTVRLETAELNSSSLQLTCSGTPNDLRVHLISRSALDVEPLLQAVIGRGLSRYESELAGADIQFDGSVADRRLRGTLLLHRVKTGGVTWPEVRAFGEIDEDQLLLSTAKLISADVQASIAGRVALRNWALNPEEAKAEVAGTVTINNVRESAVSASGVTAQFRLTGTVRQPLGTIALTLSRPAIFGQQFNAGSARLELSRGKVTIEQARLSTGRSAVDVSGKFDHGLETLANGRLSLHANASDFALSVKGSLPVTGTVSATADTTLDIRDFQARLAGLTGTLTAPAIHLADAVYTDVAISAKQVGSQIAAGAAARFAGEPLQASILIDPNQVNPNQGNAMRASVSADRLDIQTVARALRMQMPDVTGTVAGTATVDGPLSAPAKWHAKVNVSDIALQPDPRFTMHNVRPAVLEVANGTAHISDMTIGSDRGELSVRGDIALNSSHAMQLAMTGSVGLEALEMLNPNVVSSGEATVNAAVSGTVEAPLVNGTVAVRDGSFSLKNAPSSLTGIQAQVRFSRNRATITSLSAESGGGHVDVGGTITYVAGTPLTYNLNATAHDMRYRYANAIGITGDSTLRLTGTTSNGLLSGNVMLSRVAVAPEMDLGAVLASTAAARASGIDRHDLLSGLQLDIHVASQPNLQVSTAIARDVEAAIDVRVRGTPGQPLVFGNITANEGDLRIFGAKYSINRCQITFANTTRVEPVLDLDLETQSRGIAVNITVTGALDKLNMTYRSDPPLQPRDIIALLTVGKPPSFDPAASARSSPGEFSALQAGANSLLGQAIAPASNSLAKLFGITNIKIDPLVQGLTNTPQSRLTVEQQISKNVTVTYVTNLAQTSEQIFRFEWSLNPQYSVVAVRDDNGEFGIDVQYKKRFH